MARTPLRDRTAFDDVPVYLPEQNAVLVGRVPEDAPDAGALTGAVAYYVHWRDGVHLGRYDAADHTFVPRVAVEADERVMATQTRAFVDLEAELGAPVERTAVGDALLDAAAYAATELLPPKQAHVYALREHGFTRQAIAEILNVSPSTVDSQRYSATEKVEAAESFVSLRREKRSGTDAGTDGRAGSGAGSGAGAGEA